MLLRSSPPHSGAQTLPAPDRPAPGGPAGDPFRDLVEHSPAACFILQHGRFAYVNPRLADLSGYTRSELVATLDLADLVDEADGPRVRAQLDRLLGGAADALPVPFRLRRKDGAVRDVELSGARSYHGGQPAFAGTLLDLTAQRQAEAQAGYVKAFYEQILDQLPAQMVIHDTEGRYLYITPNAVKDPEMRQWMIGKTNLEYFARRGLDTELAELRHGILQQVVRERTGLTFEETMHARDGSAYHYIRIMTPIVDPDGTIRHVVGHSVDVTERKRYEAQLILARDHAEEMTRLKTSFLANMSHEIRTPLTGILGFAEILAEEAGEENREFARLIRSSGLRLLETLNSVLDLAQLEGRSFRLTPTRLDLGAVAREALHLFHPQAEARGLQLLFEQAVPGPVVLETDRGALGRVLTNLLANALKFTHEGHIRVTVGADAAGGVVRVEDTGIGIAEDFLPYLFDEFKQESMGHNRDYEGSGLGLAITKRLLDLLGGTIEVESEKGRGTVFTVRLPGG